MYFFFDDEAKNEEMVEYSEQTFESIKHYTEDRQEFWYARDLQRVLEYTEWRNFTAVIEKAKTACLNSGQTVEECFVDVNKTSPMPHGGVKQLDDIMLSRYACYLIEHNKSLAEAAQMAGVIDPRDYAIFQNKGYQGLYGGLGAKEIHARKGLKPSQKILDHMGSTELAANLFRATQTDEKLRRESIRGKEAANKTHYEVGRKVRQTIAELGGTMPEDLPTPQKSIKQIESEQKKMMKQKD